MTRFSAYWTEKLGKAIDKASKKPYPMELPPGTGDFKAVAAAINQGIDAHLQAIFFVQSAGTYGRIKLVLEPQSVSVLVRRLLETGEDCATSFASSLCETLGIELI